MRIFFIICFLFSSIVAWDNNHSDSSYLNLQNETNGKIHPLENKKYGVELNPVFLLVSTKDNKLITGTFSLFHVSRKAEIAFPFEYTSYTDDEWYDEKVDFTRFSLDVHYRKFLSGEQGGLYFSGGIRYSYVYGIDDDLWWDSDIAQYHTANKFGLCFGIGYRYFSSSGLYWGISLFGGKYFTDNEIWIGSTTFEPSIIIDMEIMKFGYAF